ncbi:TPR repeat-containing protein YrrB [Pseudodesulfovibrio hydrargyri]|uniref:TPR repeat-containing protein YrrB n=1 Tax=Pseudodesulfovibrio hydrargyri TaxID=2125990 RepID=A0A1J5MT92_9BACT|nr:tetratricopeptide repeat protein [Pseudodesulfovibrio hydrargyri]OIQ49076.1 TPR repeat-containing protein YrrB [Pseudodesulfovibrio hydrargyri]
MKKFIAVLLLASVLSAAGCATVMGPYYLEQEEYEEGIKVMSGQLRENPDDAPSAYYVGRYYLALNKPEQALPYLQKAVRLDPASADYVFWTGVAYWAMMDFDRERAAYEKAIGLDPNHISAHLYLGHGYADRGQWAQALRQYEVVLKLDPYNPEALYNRARALRGIDRTSDEIAAWKRFLEYYPDGSMAMTATEQLNLHGDFTYRNHIIGKRNVTLRSLAFKPGTSVPDADGRASLDVLSAMMRVNRELTVNIVAYVKGNAPLAKARANAVRDYMLNGNPDVNRSRLPLSWFGTAENVQVGDKAFALDQSVNFITEVR